MTARSYWRSIFPLTVIKAKVTLTTSGVKNIVDKWHSTLGRNNNRSEYLLAAR
jgi:hypothetical protein